MGVIVCIILGCALASMFVDLVSWLVICTMCMFLFLMAEVDVGVGGAGLVVSIHS